MNLLSTLYTLEPSVLSRFVLIPAASLAILFVVFLLPGIVWRRALFKPSSTTEDLLSSWFLMSLLVLVGATTIAKILIDVPLTQSIFFVTYLLVIVCGVAVCLFKKNLKESLGDLRVFRTKEVRTGAILCFILIGLMYEKIFVEGLIVDGIEAFEFSKSLTSHVLPYWDLENGFFGFYPNFLFFSYPNVFTILLLGENEAAVRLPFFLYLFLAYVIAVKLIYPNGHANRYGLGVIALAFFLLATVQGHYYTWQVPTDLAEPGTVDLLFGLLLITSCYYLINNRLGLFLLFGVLGTLTLPSGRLLLALSILAFAIAFKPGKRRVIGLILCTAGALVAVDLASRAYIAVHPQGEVKFSIAFMIGEYVTSLSMANLLWDIKTLLIVGGITPVVACFFLTKSNTTRFFLYLAAFYFAFVLVNPYEKLHYFLPLSLLITIIAMRNVTYHDKLSTTTWYSVFGVSFLALSIQYYPRHYEVQTMERTVGFRTCIAFSSYREAVRHTLNAYEALPLSNQLINPHSWIHYSDVTDCPKEQYDFYFGPRPLPGDEYVLQHGGDGNYFYTRQGAELK